MSGPVFEKMPGFCPDFGLKLPGFALFLTFFARIRSEGPGSPDIKKKESLKQNL
jgi:hypothetical protein